MSTWKELNTRAQANTKRIQETVPEMMREYKKLQNVAYAEGALDKKTKEFIALTYAIADKCEGCIGNHINKLVELGASRQEIAEIAEVAVVMGGGPGMVYSGKAMEAYDEAVSLKEDLAKVLDVPITIGDIGPVIGLHVGPGAVGIAYRTKYEILNDK